MRSHHWERRAITTFLLTLLAAITLQNHEPATLAVLLTAPGTLLARIIAFYFPRPRQGGK
jgi:hypothetical protein